MVQKQTYRHLLYLLLSLPLVLVYFASMTVGLALGFGTLIIVVGVGVLVVTLGLARAFGRWERSMSKSLLGAVFEPRPPVPPHWRAMLTSSRAWSIVLYLFLRFPLGVAGFCASIFVVASALAMAAPLIYTVVPYTIDGDRIATPEEALLISLFGFVFFLAGLHVVNGVAAICRRLATALL